MADVVDAPGLDPGSTVVLLGECERFALAEFDPQRGRENRGDFVLQKVFHP